MRAMSQKTNLTHQFCNLIVFTLIALGFSLAAGATAYSQTLPEGKTASQQKYLQDRKAEAEAIPDPPKALPKSRDEKHTELQYMIKLGETLMRETNTHPLTAKYIKQSGLTCDSCHPDAGKKKAPGATFIGTAASFPTYNHRDGGIVTLQDRINSCFMRSMNGFRLPANSEPLLAMVAYITWLSDGLPVHMNPDRAVSHYNASFPNPSIVKLAWAGEDDPEAGKPLYEKMCADCHGTDGAGDDSAPPVWGPTAYNQGAGMYRNVAGGSWVQFNMPPGEEFTLSDQQALDIMAYINSNPHPAFVETDHLPAKGANYGGAEIVYHYGRNYTAAERAARISSVFDGAGPISTSKERSEAPASK